jgi:sulfur-oxidizing protein SoxZ
MARALINVPPTARRGDVVEIKAMIAHPMETGFRPLQDGSLAPRDIIHHFACVYGGEEVFRAELHPAISANPFLAFTLVATESGEITFSWTDDRGETQTERARITVE